MRSRTFAIDLCMLDPLAGYISTCIIYVVVIYPFCILSVSQFLALKVDPAITFACSLDENVRESLAGCESQSTTLVTLGETVQTPFIRNVQKSIYYCLNGQIEWKSVFTSMKN